MEKQSRITGALSLMIAQAIVLFLGYLTHPLVGRLLGPEQYGIYGVILSVQTIIGMFLTLGIPSAVSRFVAQNEAHSRSILIQALRIQSVIAVMLSAGTALFAPLIANALNDPSLTDLIRFMAGVLLLQAFYPIFVQYFSGMHRFNRQAILTSLYAIGKVIGAVGLLLLFDVYGAIAGFAVGGAFAAIIGWAWTRKTGGNKPLHLPLKEFMGFASAYVLILVGLQLLMSLDLFMVKAIIQDDKQAGFYSSAVNLARISYFLLQGLSFIVLPSVSALTKPGESHDKAAEFIKDMLRYLIALIIPAITIAAATSKQLIILFFSHEYISAAPALTILMVGVGALAFYLLLANIMAGAGKAKIALSITGSLIVLSAVLGYILIPRFGLTGAAWQTTTTSLIGLTILGIYTFKAFQIPFPYRSTINIILATVVAVLPTYIKFNLPVYLLPLQYVVLFGIYGIMLLILGEISKEDRLRFSSAHPKLSWLAPK